MPRLLDPIRIGSLGLLNRLVMPPMDTGLATTSGEVTDAQVEHYRDRASGVGLVIVEHSYVALAGRASLNQLGVHRDQLVPGLHRVVQAVQGQGSRVAAQLNHCGAKALPDSEVGSPAGPSAKTPPGAKGEVIPRQLSLEDIVEIVNGFGQAARRAREAGFDAVEVHGAHGYLNNQFTSLITNQRSDRYGGDLENRMRLPVEIVAEVRRQVGTGYPVLYRLGASDMMEGGVTIQEGQRIAAVLVEAGADAIDVSGGLVGFEHPSESGQGYFIPLAEEIRQDSAVKVPVIGVGGIKEPAYADQVIQEGRVDMVAVGRAILNDPQWAQKAVDSLSKAGHS